MKYDKYDSQCYENKILSQNTETLPTYAKNSFQQPPSLIYGGSFNRWNEYYFFEKEEEEEKERERKSEERYREMCFMYSIFCTRQYNINNNNYYNNQPSSFPIYITSKSKQETTLPTQYFTINSNPQMSKPAVKIPYAIKFYKCKGCSNEILVPIYNFIKQIPLIKEFNYESFCQIFHKKYHWANLGKLLKDRLFSKIKTDPSWENTPLNTITIPNLFVETPIPSIIVETLSKIYDFDDPTRWLFELLTVDKFIDIGDINSDHGQCEHIIQNKEII